MEKIKIGVVGAGHFGQYHIQNLQTLRDYCEIIGIHDINDQHASHVSHLLGTHCFQVLEQLLEAVDAIVIAVNAASHAAVAMKAIAAGCHVFIEKPMAANTMESRAIIDQANMYGVKIQIGHIERFNPLIRSFFSGCLKDAEIFISRTAPFSPRGSDVSVVHDLMIHDLDILNAIIREKPSAIRASGIREKTSFLDSCAAHLTYPNGISVSLEASRLSSRKVRKYYGTFQGSHKEADLNRTNGTENPLKEELVSFLRSIIYREPILVDGYNGLRAVELADAIANACI